MSFPMNYTRFSYITGQMKCNKLREEDNISLTVHTDSSQILSLRVDPKLEMLIVVSIVRGIYTITFRYEFCPKMFVFE